MESCHFYTLRTHKAKVISQLNDAHYLEVTYMTDNCSVVLLQIVITSKFMLLSCFSAKSLIVFPHIKGLCTRTFLLL